MRDTLDHRLEDLVDPDSLLCGGQQALGGVQSDDVVDLLARALRLGALHVDLVDDRDDGQVVLERHVGIGERLRLDALRGVHDEQGALAGGEAPAHLVAEVHVAGCVDEVEQVLLARAGSVGEGDRVGLDRDAPLALEVHVVEHLVLHLAGSERACLLQNTVGKGRLAVIDVRDDGEVPDLFRLHVPRVSAMNQEAQYSSAIRQGGRTHDCRLV